MCQFNVLFVQMELPKCFPIFQLSKANWQIQKIIWNILTQYFMAEEFRIIPKSCIEFSPRSTYPLVIVVHKVLNRYVYGHFFGFWWSFLNNSVHQKQMNWLLLTIGARWKYSMSWFGRRNVGILFQIYIYIYLWWLVSCKKSKFYWNSVTSAYDTFRPHFTYWIELLRHELTDKWIARKQKQRGYNSRVNSTNEINNHLIKFGGKWNIDNSLFILCYWMPRNDSKTVLKLYICVVGWL